MTRPRKKKPGIQFVVERDSVAVREMKERLEALRTKVAERMAFRDLAFTALEDSERRLETALEREYLAASQQVAQHRAAYQALAIEVEQLRAQAGSQESQLRDLLRRERAATFPPAYQDEALAILEEHDSRMLAVQHREHDTLKRAQAGIHEDTLARLAKLAGDDWPL